MDRAHRDVLLLGAKALALLPVLLVAWYFASTALAGIPVRLAGFALGQVGVEVKGSRVVEGVATYEARIEAAWRPGAAAGAGAELAIDVPTRSYTFGLALYLALVFASGRPWRPVPRMAWAALLVALPASRIAFDALRQLASLPALGPVLGWSPILREAVALGYQVGSLLLPTLAPVGAWVASDPRVLQPGSTPSDPGR